MPPARSVGMRRAHSILALQVVLAGASACQHTDRPGVTSLTSVSISAEPPGAARIVTIPDSPRAIAPAPETAPLAPVAPEVLTPQVGMSTSTRPRMRAPLVSPGLDNTITGGIANTGALFDCVCFSP